MKPTSVRYGIGRTGGTRLGTAWVYLLSVALVTGVVGPAGADDPAGPTAGDCSGAASEGWNSGTENGWQGFGGGTAVAVTFGGNPGGYLQAERNVSVAVQSSQTPWAADYNDGGIRMISLDLKAFGGNGVTGPSIKVRGDASSNGWSYAIGAAIPANGPWQTFRVWFDTTWTDDEAEAAGWSPPGGADEWSFSETMASVGYLILGAWDTSAGETVGFDNVVLSCPIFVDGFESGDAGLW